VSLQICHLLATQTVPKLVQEPGLAHAGCAGNPHDLSATALNLAQQPLEKCQLLLAAHKLTQSTFSRSDSRRRLHLYARTQSREGRLYVLRAVPSGGAEGIGVPRHRADR
jgi:hypothetical protein